MENIATGVNHPLAAKALQGFLPEEAGLPAFPERIRCIGVEAAGTLL